MNFIREKIVKPFSGLLKQGVSSHSLALAIALGICIGFFPIIGPTTLMCFIAAWLFRVNTVAIQLANYGSYPLQILTIVPFYKYAMRLSGTVLTENLTSYFSSFAKFADLCKNSASLIAYALLIWLCVAVALGILIYFTSFFVIERLRKAKSVSVSRFPTQRTR